MRFQLVSAASHVEGNRTYGKGDIVKSDKDLVVMFPNRFRRVPDEEAVQALTTPPPAPEAQEAPLPPADPPAPTLGMDKTVEFDGAEKAGVLVFKHGQKFNIAKRSAPTVPVNVDKLSKAEAMEFIKEMLE
jgi:hypothetical protein